MFIAVRENTPGIVSGHNDVKYYNRLKNETDLSMFHKPRLSNAGRYRVFAAVTGKHPRYLSDNRGVRETYPDLKEGSVPF